MTTTPHTPPHDLDDRRLGWLLAVLCVGAIASILDSTIVNIALDHLSRVFTGSLHTTQWLMTGFLLAMAAASPLSGWLLDRFGGRAAWATALGLFLVGSVLCGCATTLDQLIGYRILQGLGAGLILPVLMAILTRAAGKQRLLQAMGIFTVLVQVGPVAGPVAGSLLIRYATWRWIFLANIPFCLIGLAGTTLVPRAGRTQTGKRLDLLGLVVLSGAMVAPLYGFGQIDPAHPNLDAAWCVPLLLGAVLLAAYIAWSLHQPGRALLDVRLFRDRDFSLASLLATLAGFVSFGGLLLLPLYFEQVLTAGVIRAGVYLIAQGLGTAALVLAGKKPLAAISDRRRAIAGFLAMTVGTVPFCLPSLHGHLAILLVALGVRGIGIGLAVPVINHIALATLPRDQVADGSTAFNIVQRLGAPFGTTLLSIVLVRSLTAATPTSNGLAHAYSTPFCLATAITLLPALVAAALARPVDGDPTTSTGRHS